MFPRKPGQLNSEAERWRKTMEYGLTIRPIENTGAGLVVFIAPGLPRRSNCRRSVHLLRVPSEDTPSAIVNGELINRKFNKGTGIKAICDDLGCSLADTIGFGDSDTDLQMTDVVGISVCITRLDNLKKLSDRISAGCDGGRRGKGAQNSGPDLSAALHKRRDDNKKFPLHRAGLLC